MYLKSIISILKKTFIHWRSHHASRMGAALSYYTVFSIIPLLMLVLAFSSTFLGNDYIQNLIVNQVGSFINTQSGDFIRSILNGLEEINFDFYTILIGISILIMGVLGVFYELKSSLDDLWDIKETTKEKKTWKYFLSSHLLALSMIPILLFLLIISVFLSLFISYISGYSHIFNETTLIFQSISYIFSFILLSCLFTFIYRFLPKRKLPWNVLIRGAVVTAVLFIIGKAIISLYISNLSFISIFGTAEVMAVLLIWNYYSVQIFLFGASFTYIYSTRNKYTKGYIA